LSALSEAAPRVLYVVYWGAAEPLGQSLVLPAVLCMAEAGIRLTLVTFDKPADFHDRERMGAIRERLTASGVRWIALKYHKRPRLPATTYDVLHGWSRGVLSALQEPPDIVHARTFIGGTIGLALAPALRAKLIYHNEGFYPDEQVDGGFWAQGSALHRASSAIERRLYARADGLVALSRRAQQVLEGLPAVQRRATPVVVVPSCVDLERFVLRRARPPSRPEEVHFVYMGAVGGRYILDRVGRFLAVAASELGRVQLRVLSRADPALVESMLASSGLPREAWSLDYLPHEVMPEELSRQDAGLFFLTQGLSEHGCSPTKVGEYWASGLPVVTTPNVSDIDELVLRHRAGVVVTEHSDAAYRKAAVQLRELLADPDTPRRCREAAEGYYALRAACERQVALYHQLVSLGRKRERRPA